MFSSAHLATALKWQTNPLYRSLEVTFWRSLIVLNWVGITFLPHQEEQAFVWEGRGLWHVDTPEDGDWSLSVLLDLLVAV